MAELGEERVPTPWVTILSKDAAHEFFVEKSIVLTCPAWKNEMNKEGFADIIETQFETKILEIVIEYLHHRSENADFTSIDQIPDFKFDTELTLEVMKAANELLV